MSNQVAAQHAAQAATPERVLAGKGPEVDGPVLDRTEEKELASVLGVRKVLLQSQLQSQLQTPIGL